MPRIDRSEQAERDLEEILDSLEIHSLNTQRND